MTQSAPATTPATNSPPTQIASSDPVEREIVHRLRERASDARSARASEAARVTTTLIGMLQRRFSI